MPYSIPISTNNIGDNVNADVNAATLWYHDDDTSSWVPVEDNIGLPVQLLSQTAIPKQVSTNFTRPNDTTAYAAGDAVTDSTSSPTAMTFSGCAKANAGSGLILGALMVDSANQATKGVFELWLFAASPTPDNDNAVFTPTDAECATLVGIIPLFSTYVGDATSGAGGNAVYESAEMARPFTCGGGSTSLFGLLVVRNAYTPVAQEVFTLILRVKQT